MSDPIERLERATASAKRNAEHGYCGQVTMVSLRWRDADALLRFVRAVEQMVEDRRAFVLGGMMRMGSNLMNALATLRKELAKEG
jgi:hypothetical protein